MSRLAFICILFLLSLKIQAQDSLCIQKLSAFVENINTFTHLYPQEKVYLHFDNTGYYLGENIWFKAYVVVAESNQLTVLSRVLYVELLSPEGEIIETKKLKIENGQCAGDFFLKTDRYGGFYEVRAYTRLMLNQEETVFSRVFPVFDSPKKEGDYETRKITERPHSKKISTKRPSVEKQEKVNIRFFPEGGNLISGLNSRVAFKATDDEGRGIDITGTLLNEKKESITSFSTMHNGMGYFTFTPENTSSYSVSLQYEGKDYSFKTPFKELLLSGYVINVNNIRKDDVLVQVQRSDSKAPESLGLSFSCRGKVHVFEVVDITTQGEYLLKVPKASLPTGVNQITLFTSEGEILSERLVFINHNDQPTITTQQSKPSYEPFENIELDFLLTDKENNPVQGNTFSVSVRDAATSSIKDKGSLFTELLLASDLKGYIEDADYYFESNDNKHQLALDLLMMTQGWRRYSWKQMAGVEPFELKHHIEKGIVIDGQVLSVFRKKIKENLEVKMWMYSEDGFSQQGVCMTDENGRFNFLPEDFTGEWKLSLQTTENGKRKENRVLIDRQFAPPARPYSYFDFAVGLLQDMKLSDFNNGVKEDIAEDSIIQIDSKSKLLPELKVVKKVNKSKLTTAYEVGSKVDALEDKGEDYPGTILNFLSELDPYFTFEVRHALNSGDAKGIVEDNYKFFDYGFRNRLSKNLDILYYQKRDEWDKERIDPLDMYYDLKYKGKPVTVIIDDRNFHTGEPEIVLIDEIKEITVSEQSGADVAYNSKAGSSGVLITFHTYSKNRYSSDPKGIRLTHLQGYSENSKEFYSPDYSNGILPDEKDYRRTLYWNPNVKTDNQGKASVRFYNNGSCRQMLIRAEAVPE